MTNAVTEAVGTATSAVVGNATAAVQSTVAAATSALQNMSINVAPGPLLQWLTIGYIGLLIVSLYPITFLVQKCRKRRKRKSASRRARNGDDSNRNKNVAVVDQKSQPLAKAPSGETDSESSDDDDDSKITAYYATGPHPTNVSRNQDYVSPTLPQQHDDNVDDAASQQSQDSETLTDLITDWRISRNENTGEALMVDMAGLPVVDEAVEIDDVLPSLLRTQQAMNELIGGTAGPSTECSQYVGYSDFAGRRKSFIATQLAAQSGPPQNYTTNLSSSSNEDFLSTHRLMHEPVFFIHKQEETAGMSIDQGVRGQCFDRCGLIEIDDESCHGEEVPNTLYKSYQDDESVGGDHDNGEVVHQGAYDEYTWDELPPCIKDAAKTLGYDEISWDGGYDVPTTEKKWDELTVKEKVAAARLGYNEDFWNRSHSETLDASRINDVIRGFETFRAVLRCNKESRKIAKIAIPTTIENMAGTILNAIQLAYISKYIGSEALVVFGMIDFALSLTEIIGAGIAAAEEVMVAQFIGGGDYYRAGATVQLSIFLYMLVAIPTYVVWIFCIGDLCHYFELGYGVAQLAQVYLPIVALAHLINDGFSGTLGGLMSIDGKAVQISLIDILFSALQTAAVVVGIVQYNIGLVEVAWIEVVSAAVYGFFMFSLCSCMGWLNKFKQGLADRGALGNRDLRNRLVCSAIPLCMSEFLGEGEWYVLTIFAVSIGDVATWTIAGAIWEIFEQSPEGIGTAAVIRIGYHLGQADPRRAKIAAYKSLLACLVWSATLTTIFMVHSSDIIALFTNDETITATLSNAVVLIGAGNCVMCIGNLAWTILSAQSRPHIPAWVYGGVGIALISIPLGSVFTFKLQFDIVGLIAAIVLSYATVSAILLVFIFTSNWTKICCRIISAYSGVSFDASYDEEKGERRDDGSSKWKSTNGKEPGFEMTNEPGTLT